MQIFQLSLLISFFICSVAAVNSGINVDSDALEAALLKWHTGSATSSPQIVKRETNAERFRRGLGPLPPARKRARSVPKASANSIHCIPLTSRFGTIQVKKESDGAPVGFVGKNYDVQTSFTITTDATAALQVSLPSISPFGTPIDITALNGQDPNHILVGAVGGSSGSHFESGLLGSAYLSGTGHTDAGLPPSTTAGTSLQSIGYNAPSESQIWTLDCATRTFTATWTNPDDTQFAATTIFFDPLVEYLGLTGDLNQFNAAFNEEAFAVTFTFIPI